MYWRMFSASSGVTTSAKLAMLHKRSWIRKKAPSLLLVCIPSQGPKNNTTTLGLLLCTLLVVSSR